MYAGSAKTLADGHICKILFISPPYYDSSLFSRTIPPRPYRAGDSIPAGLPPKYRRQVVSAAADDDAHYIDVVYFSFAVRRLAISFLSCHENWPMSKGKAWLLVASFFPDLPHATMHALRGISSKDATFAIYAIYAAATRAKACR